MIRAIQLSLLLAAISLPAFPLAANENVDRPEKTPAAAKPAGAEKAAPADVKTLIAQLKSGKYQERNEATKKLMAVGSAAIEPVAKAGMTDDLELGARCVDVLKHYLQNGDAASKAAARKALQELRTSKHASVAKWAGEALQQRALGRFPNGFPNRRGLGGRFGGARRGGIGFQREVTAVDNGKTIHIKETILPGNRQIVVKVTEKVDGKDKTTEYKATSPLELRQKNKEIHDLYLKHIAKAKLMIVGPNNAAIPVQVQRPPFGARPAGGIRTMTSRTINGDRVMTVSDGNRQIVIRDKDGKNISMSISETVNGARKTTRVEADDLDDLKKKNADAAKLYQQYVSQAGRIVGRIPLGRAGGRAVPGGAAKPPAAPKQAPVNNRVEPRKEIEKAKTRLQATIDKLQKLAAAGKADPKDLRQLADDIQAARQELERATRNLEP